jgi:hypothetical protein
MTLPNHPGQSQSYVFSLSVYVSFSVVNSWLHDPGTVRTLHGAFALNGAGNFALNGAFALSELPQHPS